MNTIRKLAQKIKSFWGRRASEVWIVAIVILVGFFAFGLGRLSVFYGERDELRVLYPQEAQGLALFS